MGAGAASADPYLLGRFSEAPNQDLVAGQSGPAERDSGWSAEAAPAPSQREATAKLVEVAGDLSSSGELELGLML